MADPRENLALVVENERIRSTTSVLSALRNHGPKVVRILDAKVRQGDGELTAASSTPQAMVDWYAQFLSQLRSEMVGSGRHLRTAKSVASHTGQELEKTVQKIRTAIYGVRDQFFSIYGTEVSLKLGFSRQTPGKAVELLEHVEYLIQRLEQTTVMLPEPAYGRLPVDLPEQLALLRPAIPELRRAIDADEDALRKTQDATDVKDKAIKKYDQDFLPIAHGVEALFQNAGMTRQAAAVRPIRRRGVTVVQGETPEPSGVEPAGESLQGGKPSGEEPTEEPSSEKLSEDETSDDLSQDPESEDTSEEPSEDTATLGAHVAEDAETE